MHKEACLLYLGRKLRTERICTAGRRERMRALTPGSLCLRLCAGIFPTLFAGGILSLLLLRFCTDAAGLK